MFIILKIIAMKKQLLLLLTVNFILTVAQLQAQTRVTFYTNKGNFVVELNETKRPNTTKNFITLVNKKFYDKLIFHRVINGFMIQGGDPKGDGTGGTGGTIPDELSPAYSNLQKTIAMANLNKRNTGDCQFYINLVNNTGLDEKYTAFGIVITNFAVVQTIGKVATNSNDKPLVAVVMDSVRITPVTTSIEEQAANIQDLNIYPNPFTTESVLFFNSKEEKAVELTVYNQQGQLIGAAQRKVIQGENYIPLKELLEQGYTPGIYFITVKDHAFISRQKFIVLD
jgi:peptidyl-prolyl cis-trans isomerase A (cyclophilin A)